MTDHNRAEETEQVVRHVLKTVEKFDRIGKAEFEAILHIVMQQAQKNTGRGMEEIVEKTSTVVEDMSKEYGQMSKEERSWEAMIAYLYSKYLKELGAL